jgi:hypothetical protein
MLGKAPYGSITTRKSAMTDATVICPICKSKAKPLDIIGDWHGFDCPQHSKLKVAGTAMETRKDCEAAQWEAALKRARARTAPSEWPLIKDEDF